MLRERIIRARGQHEIDFRYDDALTTADNIVTSGFIVKNVAIRNGLRATFMPGAFLELMVPGRSVFGFGIFGEADGTREKASRMDDRSPPRLLDSNVARRGMYTPVMSSGLACCRLITPSTTCRCACIEPTIGR
jgi:hypothetical protein